MYACLTSKSHLERDFWYWTYQKTSNVPEMIDWHRLIEMRAQILTDFTPPNCDAAKIPIDLASPHSDSIAK